jgi:hypothetical protein
MITTDAQYERFRIAQLRGQCRIMAAGMTIRGATKRSIAHEAGIVTKKKYKTSELLQAAEDITVYLKEKYS